MNGTGAGATDRHVTLEREAFFLEIVDLLQQPQPAGTCCGMLFLRLRELHEFRIDVGYAAGDRLGTAAAALIDAVMRPVDRCCRIADDAFAIVLPALRSENHGLLAANRLVRAFRDELRVDGRRVSMELAIGLAFGHGDDCNGEELLRRADIASFHALRSRLAVERFVPGRTHAEIPKEELREAIADNRLEVWLQPLWDLRRRRIVAAESLARWHSAARGWVSPAQFVPLAEHSGLIGDFTRWSLNTTLRHCAEARKVDPHLKVAINLSPKFFVDEDVIEQVLSALRLWNVPPDALVLEVTEGAIMEDPRRSAAVLDRFHAEGLGIAIDDFGTGYSSFVYLKQFPATELKIDQSFVRDMIAVPRARQLVRSMIDLAFRLDMCVVAEGVEDAETLEMLGEMGCDLAQGYHVGRPQPVPEFLRTLESGSQTES